MDFVTHAGARSNIELQLEALRSLCEQLPFDGVPDDVVKPRCEHAVACLGWFRLVVDDHPDSSILAQRVTFVLRRISWAVSDDRPLVAMLQPLLQTALRNHAADSEVVHNCAVCLKNLSAHVDNRFRLMSAVELLQEARHRHSGNTQIERHCKDFFNGLSSILTNPLTSTSFLDDVQSRLFDLAHQRTALTFLNALLPLEGVPDHVVKPRCVSAAAYLDWFRDLVERHPFCSNIAQRVTFALRRISWAVDRPPLAPTKAVLLAALRNHAAHVDVVRNCAVCFQNLLASSNDFKQLQEVVPLLQDASDRHSGDDRIERAKDRLVTLLERRKPKVEVVVFPNLGSVPGQVVNQGYLPPLCEHCMRDVHYQPLAARVGCISTPSHYPVTPYRMCCCSSFGSVAH
jgi:hypothetical protein